MPDANSASAEQANIFFEYSTDAFSWILSVNAESFSETYL